MKYIDGIQALESSTLESSSRVLPHRLIQAAVAAVLLAPFGAVQESFAESTAEPIAEIVVTARKREESILEVPIAITAVSAQALADYNIKDLSDLQSITPGFQLSETASFRRARDGFSLVMRGLNVGGTGDSAAALQSAATIFVDGAPFVGGRPSSFHDVERIEVLKGPQTAYFGRATFSGAINIVTKDPASEWGGQVTGEIGEFNTSDALVSVEGPIIADKLSIRATARNLVKGAQYSENVFNSPVGERKTQSGSLTFLFTPIDSLRVKVFGEYAEFRDTMSMVWDYPVNEFGNCNPGGGSTPSWICGTPPPLGIAIERLGFPAVVDDVFMDTVVPFSIYDKLLLGPGDNLFSGNTTTHAILDYEFESGMTFSSIVAYHHTKLQVLEESTHDAAFGFYPCLLPAGCDRPFAQYIFLRDREQRDRSFEARLTSAPDQRLRWIVGTSYSAASLSGISMGEIPQLGPYVSRPNEYHETSTLGVFGGFDFDITDNLQASVEFRHQRDTVRLNPDQNAVTPVSIEDRFDSTTPRVSLSYNFAPGYMLYASYAIGTRPGTFNGALLTRPQSIIDLLEQQFGVSLRVEEEELDMYELGVKGRFFDDRVQATLGIYKGQVTNQQVQQSIFVDTPELVTTITFTNNAGETDIQGVELEASMQVTDELRIDGSFGYYDTEIVADSCAQCVRIGGTLTSSHGQRIDGTPVSSGSLVGTYTVPVRGDVDWYGRAEYFYRGKTYGDRMNLSHVSDSHRMTLRTGITTGRFDVEAYLINAFNDRTPVNNQLNTDLPSFGVALKIGLPEQRQWGLRGTYRF